MDDIAIRAENLAKHYLLGVSQERYATLRDRVSQRLTGLWRRSESVGRGANSVWALKDLSFEIKQGEVVAIIGRNGAGKSTLLKVLSRITKPSRGRVEIHGRVGSLLEVGTGFHPELTGRENIFLSGAILGMSKGEIQRKFDEIVAFAEIERFIDTPVKRYSSGMYVRLAFAVAAHLEPEILLIDEVLAVGDVAFQKKCLGKVGDVARGGRTVLFVSHNMDAVRKLCPRAILLADGQKAMEGPTDPVVDEYLALGASAVAAVVPLPPPPPEAPGTATHLRFSTLDGTPQAQFRLNTPWRIVLEFEMHRPTPHVIAALGIMTMDSVGLITYWSKPQDLQPGRYQIEVICDLPLKACNLQCVVGLSQHERAFHYVQGVGHVSISEVAEGDQPFRATGAGLFLSAQEPDIQPMPLVTAGASPYALPINGYPQP